jgi:NTE family protein
LSRGRVGFLAHVDHEPWGGRVPLADGRLEHEGDALVYRARVRLGGAWAEVEARRELADDDGLDAWADATTVEFTASTGESGRLRLGPLDAARSLASAEPVGAHGALDRAAALTRLARTGLRRALATY